MELRHILKILALGFIAILSLNAMSSLLMLLSADGASHNFQSQPYGYNNWSAAMLSIALFTIFVLGFFKPLKRQWKAAGVYEAFIIALFAEMYGFPLTVFLLFSFSGVSLGFGHIQGHLLASLLSMAGILSLEAGWMLVMFVSNLLIVIGLILVSSGWEEIHRANGGLVTRGIYEYIRHPQYTGIIVITIGFLVQWPTLITLAMWPILILMYYRLAKSEEREMEERFGESYKEYERRVPMFLPSLKI